jgi:hypothetical protein
MDDDEGLWWWLLLVLGMVLALSLGASQCGALAGEIASTS